MNLQKALLSLVVVLTAGACSGGGGCGSCALTPLPAGGLPADQTIEGGAQLRISQAGFDQITQVLPAVIQDSLSGTTCVPQGGFAIVDYCYLPDGTCAPGCQANFTFNSASVSVPQDDQLQLAVDFDIDMNVPVQASAFLFSASCNIVATAPNIVFDIIISFNIDPVTGELGLGLERINDISLRLDLDATSCGTIVSAVASLVSGIVSGLDSILGVSFIRDLLTPVIEPIVQGLLPDPLGIEGVADLGALIGNLSPGTNATMEARVVPGGYVHLEGGGLSLGFITGINADEDLTTRAPELDSEPALCVPPFAAPDFGAAPALLSNSSRGNFMLSPADLFRGIPETGRHITIGASETMLDQLGHHIVSSGAFCMQIGTELIPQLNLGSFEILVPSLAELGTAEEGNDPLLMVTRPAKPIDFSIGDGTAASPSLTLSLSEFSIDFYAFLFERYTRGFTVTLDMNIGINLEFGTDVDGNPTVIPILVGLDAANIGVTVHNEEFLREQSGDIERVFPVLLNLILPQITSALGSFTLPEVVGFRLTDMAIEKVTTSEDDFLAISASLGAGSMMAMLGERFPSVALLAEKMAPEPGTPTSASARLVEVYAASPEHMLASLRGGIDRKSSVVVDLDTQDAMGRELEWTWNIEGGLWRPFVAGGRVTIEDPAFNIQGRYALQFRARAVGDYKSWDPEVSTIHVVFDSVGPRILVDSSERNAESIRVPSFDTVYQRDVEVAFGAIGEQTPSTSWGDGRLTLVQAEALADDGEIEVYARDPQGNLSHKTLRISEALVENSVGGCSSGGGANWIGVLLLLLAFSLRKSLRKIRLRLSLLTVLLAGVVVTPACNCSGDPAGAMCIADQECLGACPEGEVGQCFEEACRCLPEVGYGRIGQFSSMDMALDGTVWVSGYNSTHGDLVVASTREMGRIPDSAWQFVDGVPEGPVVLPAFTTRGGIKAEGQDVGLYTDIVVNEQGVAMVSYFDASTGSLKFAANYGGVWQVHVVEKGNLVADDIGPRTLAGQYSSISLDQEGVPSIAYFAHVGIGTAQASTEVRFAQAASAEPRDTDSWSVELVDEQAVPASEADADVLTIPLGTGLFVDLNRENSDSPILAYYDRYNGDLKLARRNSEGGFDVEILAEGGDVGRYPSIAIDADNVVHATYVDAFNQDLLYINDATREAKIVDDGYRIVGTTSDGLPLPEFHFVGDDSTIVTTAAGIYIAYQDATTHELLVAFPNAFGEFSRETIAGAESPFIGAYGFFANASYNGSDLTMSTWVVDQRNSDAWVELFKRAIVVE